MKKLLMTLMLLITAQFSFAADDECPSAIEMAEAQNHNLYKNCDYSERGLNGLLHRALAKKKESGDDETAQDTKPAGSKSVVEKISENEIRKTTDFNSPVQLQQVKFGALEKLAQECTNGFVIEGERYTPVSNSSALKLELIYHCL
jgi:hypothetical protein